MPLEIEEHLKDRKNECPLCGKAFIISTGPRTSDSRKPASSARTAPKKSHTLTLIFFYIFLGAGVLLALYLKNSWKTETPQIPLENSRQSVPAAQAPAVPEPEPQNAETEKKEIPGKEKTGPQKIQQQYLHQAESTLSNIAATTDELSDSLKQLEQQLALNPQASNRGMAEYYRTKLKQELEKKNIDRQTKVVAEYLEKIREKNLNNADPAEMEKLINENPNAENLADLRRILLKRTQRADIRKGQTEQLALSLSFAKMNMDTTEAIAQLTAAIAGNPYASNQTEAKNFLASLQGRLAAEEAEPVMMARPDPKTPEEVSELLSDFERMVTAYYWFAMGGVHKINAMRDIDKEIRYHFRKMSRTARECDAIVTRKEIEPDGSYDLMNSFRNFCRHGGQLISFNTTMGYLHNTMHDCSSIHCGLLQKNYLNYAARTPRFHQTITYIRKLQEMTGFYLQVKRDIELMAKANRK